MHQFDTVLKEILLASGTTLPARITGSNVTEWLNVEMPEVKAGRLDLVGRLASGGLLHWELQSTNDPEMVFRMLEAVRYLRRQFGLLPAQGVIYVGAPAMSMEYSLSSDQLQYRILMIDIREYPSEELLASPLWGDHLLALLGSNQDVRDTVRKILVRIARLTPRRRADMLVKLMVIAGLRKAEKIVEQESRNMPVHIDPMENEVLREWHAQAVAKGMATGIAEGRVEGRAEGRAEGMRAAKREFLAKLLEKKFGPLPGWALVKLNQWSLAELDDAVTRILDASGLSEFFETK